MKELRLRERTQRAVSKNVLAADNPLEVDVEEDFGVKNPFVLAPEPEATEIMDAPSTDARNPSMPELIYLRGKVEFFRDMLRDMFYRNQQEIDDEVTQHVNKIDAIVYPGLIPNFIDKFYSYGFWRKEPDVEFKYALAKALLAACRQRIPNFNHPLLISIVNKEPEAQYIMSSFIEE